MTVPKHHEWWTKVSFKNGSHLYGERDNDDDNEDEDDFCTRYGNNVPKSFSTPNFSEANKTLRSIGRSTSNYTNSFMNTDKCCGGELRRSILERRLEEILLKKREKLDEETQFMLFKAKQAAHMQMEVEKRQSKLKKSSSSIIEELVGISLDAKKLTRQELRKMSVSQLLLIVNQLHDKIECLNEELMILLIERDSLNAEQDTLHADIENFVATNNI